MHYICRIRIVPRQIALLRGINVGGNKRVEMARLRALMEDLGYSDVRTYVNSGNVVFSGPRRSERHLETAIAKTFGFEVPVVLRSRDELADVVAANPLRDVANDPGEAPRRLLRRQGVDRPRPGRFRTGDVSRPRTRGLSLGAGRHRHLPAREGARDQVDRRQEHRTQLAHGREAARAGRRRVATSGRSGSRSRAATRRARSRARSRARRRCAGRARAGRPWRGSRSGSSQSGRRSRRARSRAG